MNSSLQTKPSLVMAIALMTLVNGIFNIIWGVGMILNTAGFLLVCIPVSPLPIILGGFEIAYAVKLLANPPQPVQPSQTIAILEIAAVLVGNVFSLVVGILALIFYNDAAVKDYFAQLNGTRTPPTPPFDFAQDKPEVAPVQLTERTPAPLAPEPRSPAVELPEQREPPAPPKRVRKVAKK